MVTDQDGGAFGNIDHSRIPLKPKSKVELDPLMHKKPLRSLKGIQTIKDFAEQTYRLQPTSISKKPAVTDKSLLSVLNTLNSKHSTSSVMSALKDKDKDALRIYNRIQYLQHQEKKKLRRLQETWQVAQ